MTVLRVPAFAKINLALEVLGLRTDGYHEIRTLFQSIDLHDDIKVRETRSRVVVRCGHPEVPDGPTNLATRLPSRSGKSRGSRKALGSRS
jgi:4-diphosphocytidyl-2-C-methyl-D-erythritol kinase